VATGCRQRGYFLAISNPCFELWLWLHFEDVPNQPEARRRELYENNDRLLKSLVATQRRPYASDFEICAPYMNDAIQRARALDASPQDRWPQGLGTHVYRLVEDLIRRGSQEETGGA
jgi:hypothetical protein